MVQTRFNQEDNVVVSTVSAGIAPPKSCLQKEKLYGGIMVNMFSHDVCVFPGLSFRAVQRCEICKGRVVVDPNVFNLKDCYVRIRQVN